MEDISTYHLGGYLLFGRDYKDGDNWLTREQFIQKIESYQDATAIPLFIGSDEEGGTVTRASRNPNLFSEPFKSPQKLNYIGGIEEILRDTDTRSRKLRALGINVNFAPVCDVSTDPKDFIYDRTLGQDANMTADYVRLVVPAMTAGGMLPVLKHFPATVITQTPTPASPWISGRWRPLRLPTCCPSRRGSRPGLLLCW